MEILPFEEVERVAGAKVQLQQGGVTGIQQHGYCNIISTPLQGFSEDSSDEDDHMAPLAPKSEEGSVCCVCGENIPLLNKLIEHFKTHTTEVSCHLCWTKFGSVMSLALHLKNSHPRKSFMCGICRTLFRCTWHLNGHMEKHRKDAMEVKPVVKMEQTEEISIKENIRYNDMRKITLRDHSYCVSDHAVINETYNAIQKRITNDTNSTNQVSHIKTQIERLPIIDKQNDTLSFSSCPSNQSEQEHLSFKLKEEDEDRLGEPAACEVVTEEEIGLMEDDESTDTDDDVNAIPPNIRDVTGYYNIISTPLQGFSEDSSDEDDHMAPLAPKSEEGSVCCVCGENIPLLNKLIEHFKTHTAEVSCHLCWTKFRSVMLLALHLKNAHPRKSFMCGICRTLFRCTWNLNGHMEKHRKDAVEVKPVVKMEQTEEISIKENIRYTDMRKITLRDHSYCVSDHAVINDTCNAIQKRITNDINSTNQVSHIKTQIERLPFIDKQNDTLSFSSCPSNQSEQEHLSFKLKEENEDEDGLGETAACEVAAEEEIGLMEDDESTDTDDDVNTDSLPPGDTAYNPDEDFSSEPDDTDSRSSIYGRHRKKKRQKKQTPDSKRPANRNLESVDTAEKSGFQSDSPFCSYGKFAHLEKDMDDCRNKLRLACCLCNMVCKNEELLLKHTTEKHSAAGYICAYCHSVFPRLDSFKNHVCLRRPTGGMNLPATLVTQLPVVPLSGQVRPSAPALYTNQNSIKMIKIAQTVNKISLAPDPPHLTLQQLLQTTPLVPAKTTDLVPQFVAVPQTLIRPHFPQSSCVARPKVPILIPSVVRPLMPNLARMTLRIPTPSNPPFPSQVVVSFSPTVNVSAPCLVSANRTVLRQTPLANIRPLPVNVPLMTSVTCPTLVSALTEHNQPQIPPAKVQAPLKIVAMFVNQSRDLALQKGLEQSWRSKTIFPCRHCGAVSRQPSLKVRHRYLHRGSRLYRCQCGRSFQRQLHLLRHQVQHAESVRFVCAQCGNTFEGAHKLTWHKRKHRNGKQCVKKKCKAAFDCSCGQMFTRPSALLWHMLKNSKLSKPTQKNSQSVSV